jgi:hypothetical protein
MPDCVVDNAADEVSHDLAHDLSRSIFATLGGVGLLMGHDRTEGKKVPNVYAMPCLSQTPIRIGTLQRSGTFTPCLRLKECDRNVYLSSPRRVFWSRHRVEGEDDDEEKKGGGTANERNLPPKGRPQTRGAGRQG